MPDSRARWFVALGLAVGLVLSLGLTTTARWADDVAIAGTSLSTGGLDLQIGTLGTLDLSGATPGASTTLALTVSNAGSVPFEYAVDISGSGGGGLFAALVVGVTFDDCGGDPMLDGRTLAPGHSQELCVRVSLPGSASPAVAGATTALTLAVTASSGGWSDRVTVTGSAVSTAALAAPTLACGSATLGSVVLHWDAVPHATGYRVHYGPTEDLVETVPAGTLSRTFAGMVGTASVEAVFGSTSWVSAPSMPLAYSTVAGLLGHCG